MLLRRHLESNTIQLVVHHGSGRGSASDSDVPTTPDLSYAQDACSNRGAPYDYDIYVYGDSLQTSSFTCLLSR